MAKYSNLNRMSKQAQTDLFLMLVNALAGRNKSDAAKLLRDLLSEQEALMIARRLKIALLLENGMSYQQVRKEIPASDSTIAKIQLWLKTYGDGFRMAISGLEKNTKAINSEIGQDGPLGWRNLKKRYPMYFWPELILKQIVSQSNKRERGRLVAILNEMKDKTPLTKQLHQILRQNTHTT